MILAIDTHETHFFGFEFGIGSTRDNFFCYDQTCGRYDRDDWTGWLGYSACKAGRVKVCFDR